MILNRIKIILLLLVSIGLFSCSYVADKNHISTNQDEADNMFLQHQGIIKIAIILPLSGKNQDVGQSVLNSIVLYYNVLKNKNIILKIYDTQSSASVAEVVAKKSLKRR